MYIILQLTVQHTYITVIFRCSYKQKQVEYIIQNHVFIINSWCITSKCCVCVTILFQEPKIYPSALVY